MGSEEEHRDEPGRRESDDFVPGPLRTGASFRDLVVAADTFDGTADKGEVESMDDDKDGAVDRKTELRSQNVRHGGKVKEMLKLRRHPTDDPLSEWSWLSEESPLMSRKTESEWILERLSATLVRELNRQRKGRKRQPPISMKHVMLSKKLSEKTT